jgi:hypothetical protein
LERFIYFSISLEALFGVRETKEEDWEYRASRLFDLRSTLVHGGCASIDEWDGLEPYRKHTKSHPLRDATDAAMKALWLFPSDPALFPPRLGTVKIRRNLPMMLSLFSLVECILAQS